MISSIEGNILEKKKSYIIVNICGVGIYIKVPFNTYNKIIDKNKIYLYTNVIIKKDKINIYGFIKKYERDMFILLNKINGVGPKISMIIISYINFNMLIKSIINNEYSIFKSVKGIGDKIGKKILIELKDNIEKIKNINIDIEKISKNLDNKKNKILKALLVLGVSLKTIEIKKKINFLIEKKPNSSEEEIIRKFLNK